MKNKWIKLLFLGCILCSGLSFMGQEADAMSWRERIKKKLECSASYCDQNSYNDCLGFYNRDFTTAVSDNPHCFASASASCASDCSGDNCSDINPDACPAS